MNHIDRFLVMENDLNWNENLLEKPFLKKVPRFRTLGYDDDDDFYFEVFIS